METTELKTISFPKSREEILDALSVRYEVFINEQGFESELEEDGYDSKSIHIVLYLDKKPVGNVRMIDKKPILKLGRFAVLKEHRNKGYGRLLMEEFIKQAKEMKKLGYEKIFLEAQIQVVEYYESFGFITTSDVIIVEDYPHKSMEFLL
jgi:predicted GNAT family N-acyltransferase